MLESAAVISLSGEVLYWHLPRGRTATALPDSRTLWSVLWDNRAVLAGVAHTHPGAGRPVPSWTDLTTFAACDAGLGQRLRWWIATRDQLRCFRWHGPGRYHYRPIPHPVVPIWLGEIRVHTYPTMEALP